MKSGEGSPWHEAARASMGRSSLSPILMQCVLGGGLLSSDSGLPRAVFIRLGFHHYCTILEVACAELRWGGEGDSGPIPGPSAGYPTLLVTDQYCGIPSRWTRIRDQTRKTAMSKSL